MLYKNTRSFENEMFNYNICDVNDNLKMIQKCIICEGFALHDHIDT